MAGIRITLKETGQQSIARLWVANRGGIRFNVPESLRFLRLCYRHKINIEIEKNSEGELEKGFYFFNYKTKDKITIFYKESGVLQNFSFEKDEKYSKYYNKQMYQIQIGKLGFINCLSVDDRDVLFDFLTEENFGYIPQNRTSIENKEKHPYISQNKVSIEKKKEYSYKLLYNDLERIKADLIKNKNYNKLNENEQLLLDLPLIMWSKKWEYGSIFMFNWFMEGGDIIMNNDLYTFLDNWKELKEKRNEFDKFIKKYKNKPILKEVKENDFRLYALNDLKNELQKREEEEFLIDRKFDSKSTNFSRFSINIGFFDNINTPYVASFGTLGIGYLLEGKYNKEKEEIYITKIWEEINDSFDFKDEEFRFDKPKSMISQPLGVWSKSIFKYYDEVGSYKNINPSDDRLNISNSTFNSFRSKTKIGKDFHIKGIRLIKESNHFIKTIKINSNEVIYK